MGVLFGFMYVHHTHGIYKKVSNPMGLEFQMVASYSGCWELSQSPLEEQPVLLNV